MFGKTTIGSVAYGTKGFGSPFNTFFLNDTQTTLDSIQNLIASYSFEQVKISDIKDSFANTYATLTYGGFIVKRYDSVYIQIFKVLNENINFLDNIIRDKILNDIALLNDLNVILHLTENYNMWDGVTNIYGTNTYGGYQNYAVPPVVQMNESFDIYYWSSSPDTFIGDYACDVCGFTFKKSKLIERWDGALVCQWDYEEQHPRDFLNDRYLLEQSF